MPRTAAAPLALVLGVAIVFALASCGGGAKLLPSETARQITADLDSVGQLAAEGDCAGAESAALQVRERIDALGGVDAKLKRALREGAARLGEVTASCEEAPLEATEPGGVQAEAEAPGERKPKKAKEKPKEEATTEAPEAEEAPPSKGKGEASEGPEEEPTEGGEEEAPPSGGLGPGTPAGEGH